MGWSQQLDKKNGSRPRCVLIVDGGKEEVAARLTQLVGLDDVVVTRDDAWMPWGKPVMIEEDKWDTTPAKEAQRGGLTNLLSHKYGAKRSQEIKRQLRAWWNPHGGRTPTWDIATTCNIRGLMGLLLVEAKAHQNEPDSSGKGRPDRYASCGKRKNHAQICRAIAEAAVGLECMTANPWGISRDHHYQVSNRFAWSWKLASLEIPVVLLYLGFLKAEDMAEKGEPIFHFRTDWEDALKFHCEGVVDNSCWDRMWCVNGVPLLPIIRAFDQPFIPCQG